MKRTMIMVLFLLAAPQIKAEPVLIAIGGGMVFGAVYSVGKRVFYWLRNPVEQKADKAEYEALIADTALIDKKRQEELHAQRVNYNEIIEGLRNNLKFVQLRNELIRLFIQHARGPKNADGVPLADVDLVEQVAEMVPGLRMKMFLEEVQNVANQRVKAHA